MSGVVVHLALPLLIVLATGLFRPRHALVWLPMTVVADLDFIADYILIYGFAGDFTFHRQLGHTLLWPLLSGLAAWRIWRRRVTPLKLPTRAQWDAFLATKWGPAAALSCFYLFSHVLLDAFQGGAVLFWPFLNIAFYFRPMILVNLRNPAQTEVVAETVTTQGAPQLVAVYPWILPEDVGILILIGLGFGMLALHRWWFGRWGANDPSPPVRPQVRVEAGPARKGKTGSRSR